MADWQFWIDRGGTFTDILAIDPKGSWHSLKLLSVDPLHYDDAILEGIRRIIGVSSIAFLKDQPIRTVRIGTTLATNALLERRGQKFALAITQGFADALQIGTQHRPDLFALEIKLPEPLYGAVIEIPERLDANGQVISPLDREVSRTRLQEIFDQGYRALAVVSIHGWLNPQHELIVSEIAREIGFSQVSLSSQVSPLMKLVPRGDTTALDAYLTPVLQEYIAGLGQALPQAELLFMRSDGGLAIAEEFHAKDALLSGPAGGMIGCVATAKAVHFEKVIGFDMGGTSTDVCHYAGQFDIRTEHQLSGVRLRAPMLAIHTVAAGGGSILSFDKGIYQVGPDSAGANPGPKSYGKGGPLTITDANVVLGRLRPEYFPQVFGPNADQPLNPDAATQAFDDLAAKIDVVGQTKPSPSEVAWGFLMVAVEKMASAIELISTKRGIDITHGYILNAFGGAAGQHACLVADRLGIKRILFHPHAGLLSAFGIGHAEKSYQTCQQIEKSLDQFQPKPLVEALTALALSQLRSKESPRIDVSLRLKLMGADYSLPVKLGTKSQMVEGFRKAHKQAFGFVPVDLNIWVEMLVLDAHVANDVLPSQPSPNERGHNLSPVGQHLVWDQTGSSSWPIYQRKDLQLGDEIDGPAIVVDDHATYVIERNWQLQVQAGGEMILESQKRKTRFVSAIPSNGDYRDLDPLKLSLFAHRFRDIAEQMGTTLAATAHSTNIKERLDFSCALFDRDGFLVANAPHVPVHLGSMGASVQAVIDHVYDQWQPGDVYVLNDPYAGGTHLPDITVVTPLFEAKQTQPSMFVASRAHHADIGGMTPGSMPPFSTHINDEGILIPITRMIRDGRFDRETLCEILTQPPYPVRNLEQNLHDLAAQAAANETGIRELKRLIKEQSLEMVESYMGFVQDNAEEQVRQVIENLKDGRFQAQLDNQAFIKLAVRINRQNRSATIDFSGTSAFQANNFNTPASVVRAAVMYVFRCLVQADIPLNDGCMRPIQLILPNATLVNPTYPAAVVAGNVEVSQMIVDLLFAAMGVMAASQGTMNNFTFGDGEFQNYETLAGGTGAGPHFHGAGPVQSHMTNSRLTDPEILETRYPVLLESFAVRRGSGGQGKFNGGDGLIRRIKFLKPMTAALLANRHQNAPFGLEGGNPGHTGLAYIIRADGFFQTLDSCAELMMGEGDIIHIETPGGGGFGSID